MFKLSIIAALTLLCFSSIKAQQAFNIGWEKQSLNIPISMRGISVVSSEIAWASGSNGSWLRTTNGGKTWQYGTIPEAASLDFRDVAAFSAHTAYIMSSGCPAKIYKTIDGGAHWNEQYTNNDPAIFLDAMDFWDENNGMALGDPLQGQFFLLETSDGGKHWTKILAPSPPLSLDGEGCFAASGTCLRIFGKSSVYFVTGSGKQARIFNSNDRGKTWKYSNTPVANGSPPKGIFSFHFSDLMNGIVVGGDYKNETDTTRNVSITNDGGKSWQEVPQNSPSGFRECIDFIDVFGWITMGPTGCDISFDKGYTWQKSDYNSAEKFGIHSFALSPEKNMGWAVGDKGTILKFRIVR